MADAQRHKLTILDAMILLAAAAVGAWGVVAYRAGIPLPILAHPGIPVLPILLSVPVAAAMTLGFLVVPARTLREWTRHLSRQPGTALCAAAIAALLGVVIRWSLRAWLTPYVDGSFWVYGATVLVEWARTCGLGIGAAMALLTLGGRLRRPSGWIEWLRLTLAAYWLVVFLIFSVV